MTAPRPFASTAELRQRVLAVLSKHVGRAHAIGRIDLVLAVHADEPPGAPAWLCADRRVRDAIAELRRGTGTGALICSDKHGAGYFIAASREEISSHLAPERRRLASLAASIRRQEERAEAAFAEFERRRVEQMEMFR